VIDVVNKLQLPRELLQLSSIIQFLEGIKHKLRKAISSSQSFDRMVLIHFSHDLIDNIMGLLSKYFVGINQARIAAPLLQRDVFQSFLHCFNKFSLGITKVRGNSILKGGVSVVPLRIDKS
jgi:hypothetical protein